MDNRRLHIEDELLVMDARDGDAGAMDKLVSINIQPLVRESKR